MAAKEKVAKALRDAKELMNSTGAHWTKGVLRRGKDEVQYCSLGAIWQVTGLDVEALMRLEDLGQTSPFVIREKIATEGEAEVRQEAAKALAEVIVDAGRSQYGLTTEQYVECAITDWNDREVRTWDEVVEIFDRAVARVEAEDA
jgi:hypothetical protein